MLDPSGPTNSVSHATGKRVPDRPIMRDKLQP